VTDDRTYVQYLVLVPGTQCAARKEGVRRRLRFQIDDESEMGDEKMMREEDDEHEHEHERASEMKVHLVLD
jgi:hypothetical protein